MRAFSPTIVGWRTTVLPVGYAEMNNWKVSRRGLLLGALALTASGCASGGWQGAYPFAGSVRVDRRFRRQRVRYEGTERPGTIVVDVSQRFLFAVEANGWATRYGVAVGMEGLTFKGKATIGDKAAWPSWTPTASMIRRKPHLSQYAGGVPGGENNPLGARALYLYQGGRDTMFRLHGTNEPWLIGSAVSNGCIRLTNDDVIDLYDRTPIGTPVLVI